MHSGWECGEFRFDFQVKDADALLFPLLSNPFLRHANERRTKGNLAHISFSVLRSDRVLDFLLFPLFSDFTAFPPFFFLSFLYLLFPISPFFLFRRQLFSKKLQPTQSAHLPVCERNLVRLTDRLSTPGIVTVGRVDTGYIPK